MIRYRLKILSARISSTLPLYIQPFTISTPVYYSVCLGEISSIHTLQGTRENMYKGTLTKCDVQREFARWRPEHGEGGVAKVEGGTKETRSTIGGAPSACILVNGKGMLTITRVVLSYHDDIRLLDLAAEARTLQHVNPVPRGLARQRQIHHRVPAVCVHDTAQKSA